MILRVDKAIITHPPNHRKLVAYSIKPFLSWWFMIVLLSLFNHNLNKTYQKQGYGDGSSKSAIFKSLGDEYPVPEQNKSSFCIQEWLREIMQDPLPVGSISFSLESPWFRHNHPTTPSGLVPYWSDSDPTEVPSWIAWFSLASFLPKQGDFWRLTLDLFCPLCVCNSAWWVRLTAANNWLFSIQNHFLHLFACASPFTSLFYGFNPHLIFQFFRRWKSFARRFRNKRSEWRRGRLQRSCLVELP